jgi:hypothetical protein
MSSRVKFLASPAAVVLAGGFAWLGSAAAFPGGFDSTTAPQLAQATPPAAQPPAAGGAPGAMMPRPMPAFSPKEMCTKQVARRIGNRAYLKSMLDLKPEQMALWNNFEKAADDASAKDKARCATLPTEIKTPPTYIERMTMREDRMKARIASLEAVKPSLTALYASLTPEQKALLDKPRGMGGMRHHHHNRG